MKYSFTVMFSSADIDFFTILVYNIIVTRKYNAFMAIK